MKSTIGGLLERFYIDKAFLKFAIVGVVNTLVGSGIMFGCYNLLHWGYWTSSVTNYILTSILSYFLNKNFTFENKEKGLLPVFKFAINIVVCYVIAYGVAQPLVRLLLSGFGETVCDNVSMFVGMVLFIIINYFGQRLIVFSGKNNRD